jgi:hypothetical protein
MLEVYIGDTWKSKYFTVEITNIHFSNEIIQYKTIKSNINFDSLIRNMSFDFLVDNFVLETRLPQNQLIIEPNDADLAKAASDIKSEQ